MIENPAPYIEAALSSLGIICRSLDIQNYDPEHFGNLAAMVETDKGHLHITYDREFYVEAKPWRSGSPSMEQIAAALEQHKRIERNGS
jgi:hypothetical protein